MQQIIKISAPLGLVFILSLIVVVETGLLIGGLIYYNTVSDLESAGKIVPSIYNNQKPASDFQNIIYLTKFGPRGLKDEISLFITLDETGEKIMMADKDLNKNSFKLIYGLKPVGALIISPPLIFVDDYVIAEMVGGDGNDILIFNYKTGNVITAELKTNNSELKDWIIGYKERISKNIIRVSLGKIDNSTGTAQIDVAAGKMISGSLVLTGKNK